MTHAYHPKFPQTPVGSLYPINYIVCVMDDLNEAKAAVQAFIDAGFDMNTVRVMDSQEALVKLDELQQRKNIFQRFLSSFQDATDDTGIDVFRLEARQGNHLLFVRVCDAALHACSPAEIKQIRTILTSYHARTMKLFSPWWVEDLPPIKQTRETQH